MLAPSLITRILYATTDHVYIYDITAPAFLGVIDNGSGGLGPISFADFGFDDTEVMVWTALGASVCVWSLETGRMIAELKDPKHFISGAAVAKGCSWRMTTDESGNTRRGPFALLTRVGAQDVITLWHSTGDSYEKLNSWEPKTIDAQGIKWSPTGRWLVIWDAASMGFNVLIATAEARLLRTYSSDFYWSEELRGLGARMAECDRNGYWLAVAGYNQWVTVLNTNVVSDDFMFYFSYQKTALLIAIMKQFSLATNFFIPDTLKPTSTRRIQQEVITSASAHSYTTLVAQTSAPTVLSTPATSANTTSPTNTSIPPIQRGASILSFSPSSSHLATRDDSHPTTLFIWKMRDHELVAVLIQHSIIKSVSWNGELLLMTCEGKDSEGLVYTWDSATEQPGILQVHSVSGVNFVVPVGSEQGEENGHGTPHIGDGEATATTGLEDTFQNVRLRDVLQGV